MQCVLPAVGVIDVEPGGYAVVAVMIMLAIPAWAKRRRLQSSLYWGLGGGARVILHAEPRPLPGSQAQTLACCV